MAFVVFAGICLAIAGGLLIYLLGLVDQQRRSPPPRRKHRSPGLTGKVDKRLVMRLNLLAGNAKTARRLVSAVRASNPTRSDKWCYEKAIADLERDRL